MEWPLVKSLLWALVLFVQIHEHRGCIEEERIGLLELKAFMISNSNYTNHLLLSWVNGTKSECCYWEGVKCSKTTDHLIELSLYRNFIPSDDKTWFLNVSLLHPFNELRSLDFSFNTIGGWLGNEGMWKCEPSFISIYYLKALNIAFFVIILLFISIAFLSIMVHSVHFNPIQSISMHLGPLRFIFSILVHFSSFGPFE